MQRNVQAAILAATGRYVRKLFTDVEIRVKALESRPLPEKGERGDCGKEGPPGLSVRASEVAQAIFDAPNCREMLRGDPGKSVTIDDVRPLVADLVEERVKALPAPRVVKGMDPDDFIRFAEAFLRRLDEPLAQ